MPVYLKADDDMERLLHHTIEKYHARLLGDGTPDNPGVSVSIIQAWAKVDDDGNPVGAALMHHGYPALAKVRIIGQRDRVHGMADAEIIVDGDAWPKLDQARRIACLDHEMTHIEVQTHEDTGKPKLDDGGRPKLRMRLHDYQTGWFVEVAQRHGDASVERQQAQQILAENGQVLFAFMEQPAAVEEVEEVAHGS